MDNQLNLYSHVMVGHNIRVWRIMLKIKRSDFAAMFNITVEDLINYEYAFAPIPGIFVALVCEKFGLKLVDLTKTYANDYQLQEIEDDYDIAITSKTKLTNEKNGELQQKLSEAVEKCKYIQRLLNETTAENYSLKKNFLNRKKR